MAVRIEIRPNETRPVSDHKAGEVSKLLYITGTGDPMEVTDDITKGKKPRGPFILMQVGSSEPQPVVTKTPKSGRDSYLVTFENTLLQLRVQGENIVVQKAPQGEPERKIEHVDVTDGIVRASIVGNGKVVGEDGRLFATKIANLRVATGAQAKVGELTGKGVVSAESSLYAKKLQGTIVAEGLPDKCAKVQIDTIEKGGLVEIRSNTTATIGKGDFVVTGDSKVRVNHEELQPGFYTVDEHGVVPNFDKREPRIATVDFTEGVAQNSLSQNAWMEYEVQGRRFALALYPGQAQPEVRRDNGHFFKISKTEFLAGVNTSEGVTIDAGQVDYVGQVNAFRGIILAKKVAAGFVLGANALLEADALTGNLVVKGEEKVHTDGKVEKVPAHASIKEIVSGGLLTLQENASAHVENGEVEVIGAGVILNGQEVIPQTRYMVTNGQIVSEFLIVKQKKQELVPAKSVVDVPLPIAAPEPVVVPTSPASAVINRQPQDIVFEDTTQPALREPVFRQEPVVPTEKTKPEPKKKRLIRRGLERLFGILAGPDIEYTPPTAAEIQEENEAALKRLRKMYGTIVKPGDEEKTIVAPEQPEPVRKRQFDATTFPDVDPREEALTRQVPASSILPHNEKRIQAVLRRARGGNVQTNRQG